MDSRMLGRAIAVTVASATLVAGLAVAASEPAEALVGGTPVAAGARPYYAQVESSAGACGGAMIAPEWVLTARHCVQAGDASGVMVTAGWTADGVGSPIRMRGIETFHHPVGDLALVRVPPTAGVATVPLAEAPIAVGDSYVSVAAGDGSGGRLTQARFTVNWVSGYYDFTGKGVSGVERNCYGDSGSPAIMETPGGDRLVGVSYRINPPDCRADSRTFVMNVSYSTTRAWLTATMGQTAAVPEGDPRLPKQATLAVSAADPTVELRPTIECPEASVCRVRSSGAAGSVQLHLFAQNAKGSRLSYPGGAIDGLTFSIYDGSGRAVGPLPSFSCGWVGWGEGDFLSCGNTVGQWEATIPAGGRIAPSDGRFVVGTLDPARAGAYTVGHDFADAGHGLVTVWDLQALR